MSAQTKDRLIAGVALVLIIILFLLVAIGVLPAIIALVITVVIGLAVRYLRGTLVAR